MNSSRLRFFRPLLTQYFRGRPSLTGAGPAEEVEAVAAARLPLYRALAQVCVDTDSLDPPAALRAVEAAWLA